MENLDSRTLVILFSATCATLIACVAAIIASRNDAKVAIKALEGMTRQPELADKFMVNMLVGIGLVESIPIIASVIAIVLVFANPYVDLL